MSSDENRLELQIPADGSERTVWLVDENGERVNFFNIVRYSSNTIALLQQNVRVDFWKEDHHETYQFPCLATMLVFATSGKDKHESAASAPELESESGKT